jgi:hypothetical protein
MDRSGNQLFPGAGFSEYEHDRTTRCYGLHCVKHTFAATTLSENLTEIGFPAAVLHYLAYFEPDSENAAAALR